MREELFVNGGRVDMMPDKAITLNFKSNFLGDVSKVVASNSLTINLPKTPRNNAIFQSAGVPAASSRFPYKKWPAQYYRDGVEVIPAAYCVLVDVSETYNVALYWGVMANFQEWLDSEATLRQLDFSSGDNTAFVWGDAELSDADSGSGVLIADFDTGVGSFGSLPSTVALTPSVRVSTLLNKIEEAAGLRFSFSFKPEEVPPIAPLVPTQRLALPLTTTNGVESHTTTLSDFHIEKASEQNGVAAGGSMWPDWDGWYSFGFSIPESAFHATEVGKIPLFGTGLEGLTIIPAGGGLVKFRPDFTIVTTNSGTASGREPRLSLYLVAIGPEGEFSSYVQMRTTPQIVDNGTRRWRFANLNYFIEVPEGGKLGLRFDTRNARYFSTEGTATITLPSVEVDRIDVTDIYRVQDNLPDIKQVDFVIAIAQMLGLFASQNMSPTNVLAFVSVDDILSKKASAYDWSDKLLKGQRDGCPTATGFKLDSWARENLFQYEEDETVMNDGAGKLSISNENLEAEHEAVTLPFAASDWSVVPIYKLNDEGTAVELTGISPRIMQVVDNGAGKAALTFSGLGWPALLNKYYAGQSRMLSEVVTVKCDVRLSAPELKGLSFLRPVYFKQFGRYYAIRSISTSGSDRCSLELVQLPVDE